MSIHRILGIAADGMAAQATALASTGQNMANATTPGYVRRVAVLETQRVGVVESFRVASTERAFDVFSFAALTVETGRQGGASARAQALAATEAALDLGADALGQTVADFFASWNDLASHPEDATVRATVVARSNEIAERFASTSTRIQSQRRELLETSTAQANMASAAFRRIADLNGAVARGRALGADVSELLDERGRQVQLVSKVVGARSIEDESGGALVFVGGVAVVNGTDASTVSVAVDAADQLSVRVDRGGTLVDVTSRVSAGELSGVLRARDGDLATSLSELDSLAFAFAQSVNTAHAAGFGLDGLGGRSLFLPLGAAPGAAASLAVDPVIVADPGRLAASGSAAGVPGDGAAAHVLAGLASSPFAASPTPGDAFAAWFGSLGLRVQSASREADVGEARMVQARILHESRVGVSLDEESTKLSQFQRAYEASARVLRVADELFETLLRGT